MFLKIPVYKILDFTLLKFTEHALDNSPAIATRSQMRLVMKAVEIIAEAKDGVAELPDDVATALKAACEAAAIPRLTVHPLDSDGQPTGTGQPIPARAFEPFYEAVETMTAERPEPEKAPEAPALATAAE